MTLSEGETPVAIPDFQSLFRPVLDAVADGAVWPLENVREVIAESLRLTIEERQERYGSGGRRYDGRVHWAVTYLAGAGAVARVGRGQVQITDRGRELIAEAPERITVRYLTRYTEFAEFYERATASRRRPSSSGEVSQDVEPVAEDPQDQISQAVEEIAAAVASELVERIKTQSPEFLERIILDLMVAMGYGGELGHAEHLGGPGDEGFDGVIHQDALGLERIYLQAKRYTDQAVSRPTIQAFAGALQGAGASRGVFITTSRFSAEARDFASRIPARVVLIDGAELGRLLVQYRVGVQVRQRFDVVEVDDDAFEA
ncbi:MAG: restriction endonuclease [Actinomycetota bacterium]|nr:restriction endonuclease [Actinomycetota bacterium]